MRDNEDEDIFRKYLKKGYSLWGRLKFRLWSFRNKRRVRTVGGVSGDYDLIMKLVYIILFLMILRYLGGILTDIWFWFYPRKVVLSHRWV